MPIETLGRVHMVNRARNLATVTVASLLVAAGVSAAKAEKAQTSMSGGIGIVRVEGGQVSGVETDVAGVKVFKGVPFAGPTSGDNRFKPPQPVVSWEGIKAADAW